MHRLFVAIRPPEGIRDLLIDAMDDSPALRWVGDEQLHLTLRFIGEVERPVANDIAVALQQIRSPVFALRISSVGKFEKRSGGALWAGISPKEPAAALAAKVERAVQQAGIEPEHRAFAPTSPWRAGTAAMRRRWTPSSGAIRTFAPVRSRSTASSCSKANCPATARITSKSRH